jgi:hypothetical protein
MRKCKHGLSVLACVTNFCLIRSKESFLNEVMVVATSLCYLLLLFNANGFSPGGSGTPIR